MNPLLQVLKKNDKKNLFQMTNTSISYPTGFLPFDYKNGYLVEARDDDDNIVKTYDSIGVSGGTYTTIIGKSGTAKTTFALQMACNIVKKFDSGLVIHYDLEQAMNIMRVRNITGLTGTQIRNNYVLKQEHNTIEDIFLSVQTIAKVKSESPNEYKYSTGLLNEFGEEIEAYVPTIIIIDSIPTLSSEEVNNNEMESSTYSGRLAKRIAQFYKKTIPYMKAYNISIIAINHINSRIEINPFAKSQPQLMYLKMDESIPGGNAPIYYAHQLVKFVSSGKYTKDKEGIDGFRIRCELLKSRTNKAGQFVHLVYNQLSGFDPLLTLYEFASDNELVTGRNPYKYFTGNKDIKFDSRLLADEFVTDSKLRESMFDTVLPHLKACLSRVGDTTMSEHDFAKLFLEHIAV